MDDMEIMETNAILLWAEKLANKYGLGINTIVDAFVRARKETASVEETKAFIENEMQSIKRVK